MARILLRAVFGSTIKVRKTILVRALLMCALDERFQEVSVVIAIGEHL